MANVYKALTLLHCTCITLFNAHKDSRRRHLFYTCGNSPWRHRLVSEEMDFKLNGRFHFPHNFFEGTVKMTRCFIVPGAFHAWGPCSVLAFHHFRNPCDLLVCKLFFFKNHSIFIRMWILIVLVLIGFWSVKYLIFFLLEFLDFWFLDRVSLHSPGCPRIHVPLASAFQCWNMVHLVGFNELPTYQ
jgi:hypothetical protein